MSIATLPKADELTDLDWHPECESPPCRNPAELVVTFVCECVGLPCLHCRDAYAAWVDSRPAGSEFECATCGFVVVGSYSEQVISEVPLW